jgi:hypothetical protein
MTGKKRDEQERDDMDLEHRYSAQALDRAKDVRH